MSSAVQQREIPTVTNTGWTRLDPDPLINRTYVVILNNHPTQAMGLACTMGETPTSNWDTRRRVMQNSSSPYFKAGAAIAFWGRMETGPVASGSAIVVDEWA